MCVCVDLYIYTNTTEAKTVVKSFEGGRKATFNKERESQKGREHKKKH